MTISSRSPATSGGSTLNSADGLPASLTPTLVHRLTAAVQSSGRAESVSTHAPFSGARVAELPQCDDKDVLAAAESAREAQQLWAARSVASCAAVFLRLHDLVLDARDDLMDIVQAENGKSRRDAYLEVADIAVTCRYYARVASKVLRPRRRAGLIPGLTSVQELRHPKGIVTVISPWNYPLSLGAGDTIPALLAGNAVVQKPDNQTALTALYARDLAVRAGLPADLWQIVLGRGSAIGSTLLDVADFVMFTGSTASGRKIAAEAGRRLVDCSLELGGKNAMLVLADADLDRAVEGAVRACFSSSGQLCISIERMYVADEIWDRFVPRFVEAVETMPMGPGYDFSNQMGSLTSTEQLEVTKRHVGDAVAAGATVLTGGEARPDLGPLFFEPTVLTDVVAEMTCFARGDLRAGGVVVPLLRARRRDRAGQRHPLRPERQRVDILGVGRARGRGPLAFGHRQRQRGLRRGVGEHRRADGRDGRFRHGSTSWLPRARQVHRAPDHRVAEVDEPGSTSELRRRRRVRGADDPFAQTAQEDRVALSGSHWVVECERG